MKNNKESSASRIVLDSYESLFGDQEAAGKEDRVKMIPLSELHEFAGHPFRVLDDEKMQETIESVKKFGILAPGIARRRQEEDGGGYEIISGHRRRRACELAGIHEMPMFVRDYSDDEAVVVMVDSNIQREDILPSEKARAYRMKYDALKHQGARGGKNTADAVGEVAGDSATTVKRYIRLSYLTDSLLSQVDSGKITVVIGEQLSYLPEYEQALLEKAIETILLYPNKRQAEQLRENSAAGTLDEPKIYEILTDRKKKETGKTTSGNRPLNGGTKKVVDSFGRLKEAARERVKEGTGVMILRTLPYVLFFYFVDKESWLYRHCRGNTAVAKAMTMLMNFQYAFRSPLPSLNPADMAAGAAGAALLYAFIYYRKSNAKKFRQGEEYGSARWGTPKDIAPFIDPVFEYNILLTRTERLTLNSRPKNPKYARNKNVIVIGGSGSGKTRGYVKPNLMQCESAAYPVSFVVTDPKISIHEEYEQLLYHVRLETEESITNMEMDYLGMTGKKAGVLPWRDFARRKILAAFGSDSCGETVKRLSYVEHVTVQPELKKMVHDLKEEIANLNIFHPERYPAALVEARQTDELWRLKADDLGFFTVTQ